MTYTELQLADKNYRDELDILDELIKKWRTYLRNDDIRSACRLLFQIHNQNNHCIALLTRLTNLLTSR